MYSDPHPNSYRVVWLTGKGEGGKQRAFALDPFDDRVRLSEIDERPKRKALERLHRIAEEGKNFPALIDVKALAARLRRLRKPRSVDREFQQVLTILPERDLRLRVMEIQISADYSALETREIYEAPIP